MTYFLSIFATGVAGMLIHADEPGFTPHPQVIPRVEVKTMEIGSVLPDFKLPDMYGEWVRSSDFDDAEVLVIVFLCNHCPTAQAYEQRLIDFTTAYAPKGVQVVAVNPNSILAVLLEECGYSDLNDSFEEMSIRAEYLGYNFPYLYDGDDHAFSLELGPSTTPHVFLFDRERILRYSGRIDAHERPGTGHAEDLIAATEAVLSGETPELQVTRAFGCSVKWSWIKDWADRVNREWSERPVELHTLDLAGTRELVANPTDKLLLINVWATWCAPCVIEYPDFVDTHRMYMGRDFEFVSISLDQIAQKDRVLRFLTEKESALRNFIFEGEDRYEFMELLSGEWNGALPFTILIEPGGKVVWTQQGLVDFLELRRAIVDHPMIGRYF